MALNSRSVNDPVGPPASNGSGNYLWTSETISRRNYNGNLSDCQIFSDVPVKIRQKDTAELNVRCLLKSGTSATNYSLSHVRAQFCALNFPKLSDRLSPMRRTRRFHRTETLVCFSLVVIRAGKLGCRPRRWSVILRFAYWIRARIFGGVNRGSDLRKPRHTCGHVTLLERHFRNKFTAI